MGTLSDHFSVFEFACRDSCGACEVDPDLLVALEELRARVGVPIQITSGCRCSRHNSEIGGARHSYHLTILDRCPCQAADIAIENYTSEEVAHEARWVARFSEGGIGVYPGTHYAHVDIRTSGPARWL